MSSSEALNIKHVSCLGELCPPLFSDALAVQHQSLSIEMVKKKGLKITTSPNRNTERAVLIHCTFIHVFAS